jgi:hypothetical protein
MKRLQPADMRVIGLLLGVLAGTIVAASLSLVVELDRPLWDGDDRS